MLHKIRRNINLVYVWNREDIREEILLLTGICIFMYDIIYVT